MKITRSAVLLMAVSLVMLAGCKRGQPTPVHHPAKLEETGEKGIMRVVLEEAAVERTGIQTAPVREEMVTVKGRSGSRLVIPYGALLYDYKGDTWAFTNPEPLVYVRHKLVVETIEGDRVILAEGPPAGTAIVTVGASELMGAELKYGH